MRAAWRYRVLEEPPEKTFGFYDIPWFQYVFMVFEEPNFFGCQIGLRGVIQLL